MRKMIFAAAAAALVLLSGVAQAATFSAPYLQRTASIVLFSGTSPASAVTTAQAAVTGLDVYSYCFIYAKLAGGTGGTLDVYIQTSYDGGTTWVDMAHYPQFADGGAATNTVFATGRRGVASSATSPVTTTIAVNSTSGTPLLAANTFIQGLLGNALRVVTVAGTSTSAGATLAITAFCSN